MFRFNLPDTPDIVLVDGRRTPFGSLLGALSDYEAPDLASICLQALEDEEVVDPQRVDEVIIGSVLQGGQGQAPARQASIGAGWSPGIPAVTINKVCGSSIKSILQASQGLLGGPLEVAVVGGMESMTNAPHFLPDLRKGKKLGPSEAKDMAVYDGLWCSMEEEHMGAAGERIAERYGLTREELDEFSLMSHRRADRAWQEGKLEPEVVSLPELERDESVRPDTSLEQLEKLPPAFRKDGKITAGNAPGLNDGAVAIAMGRRGAFTVPADRDTVFRLEGYAVVGDDPGNFVETPAAAIEVLLEDMKWSLDDVDRIEINEAFSSQVLGNCHRLEIDPERINRWGGAISIGHPIGSSGSRIVLALMNQLRQSGEEKGIASICMGGGNGIALAIRQIEV